ncbi:MAG: VOC family protein [Promethearchaeota archaeon]
MNEKKLEGMELNLGSLKVDQLGYVYRDIEKQARFLESQFHLPKFAFFDNIDTPFKYRGKDTVISTKIGLSRIFSTQIELIQLIKGECIFKEFLDAGKEGLHHFGIFVDDLDSYVKKFTDLGYEIVHQGQTWRQKVTYFDTMKPFGILIEFQETITRKKKKQIK